MLTTTYGRKERKRMVKTQNVDTALLDEYIEKSGRKLGYIIEKLGISRQAFDRKRRSVTPFRVAEVYVLCDVLDIPPEDKEKIFCF